MRSRTKTTLNIEIITNLMHTFYHIKNSKIYSCFVLSITNLFHQLSFLLVSIKSDKDRSIIRVAVAEILSHLVTCQTHILHDMHLESGKNEQHIYYLT